MSRCYERESAISFSSILAKVRKREIDRTIILLQISPVLLIAGNYIGSFSDLKETSWMIQDSNINLRDKGSVSSHIFIIRIEMSSQLAQ